MLKASALYLVIIIALVIALLCSSLIVVAYFYKMEYQKKFRYDKLLNNVNSGVNILIASENPAYAHTRSFSLFDNSADSVSLQRVFWGMYDIGISKAFDQKDTLYKTFTIASTIDSSKWAALYSTDQDRSIAVSGKTMINGDAYIPRAGITTAFVDNKAYEGDKRLITGVKHQSEKVLPDLDKRRLEEFKSLFHVAHGSDSTLLQSDSIQQSFLIPPRYINFKKKVQTIKNLKLRGNIVLFSDTTLIIDSTVILDNVMVFAKAITVKRGFHGKCQFFASDSIRVKPNCHFDYPSCLGVLRFNISKVANTAKIVLEGNSTINGIVFTYDAQKNNLQPSISLGPNVKVIGQIYSQGVLEYKDDIEIDGSIFTSRLIYKSTYTLFENYLINIKINAEALSRYYLTSELIPVASKKKKVLQWLEKN
ncbi:hypothetical protein BH09BAC6_BH09BAC6_10830 [soil metagenome]